MLSGTDIFQHSNKEWQLFDSVAFKSEGQHASNMENTKKQKTEFVDGQCTKRKIIIEYKVARPILFRCTQRPTASPLSLSFQVRTPCPPNRLPARPPARSLPAH